MEHYNAPLYAYQAVELINLYNRRETYEQYPRCQRDYVWKSSQRDRLIDTILRGLPIPPVTVMPGHDTLIGRINYIVDGQQRIRTILDYMDDKFPAGSNKRVRSLQIDAPGMRFIEADKYYSELSLSARQTFDNYPLQFCIVHNIPPELIGLVFRRLNIQVQLNFAEKMFSYDTRARHIYEELQSHEFFRTVYVGNNDRKQAYMATLGFILMEIMSPFANLTTPRLVDVADGTKDNDVTMDLKPVISRRLSQIVHAYDGFPIKTLRLTVPIYQSVMLLEMENVKIENQPKGFLALWIGDLYQKALEERRSQEFGGEGDLFTQLTKVHIQHKFWEAQLPVILSKVSVIRDKRRAFSTLDRITAWNRQSGKCPVCGSSVRFTDEAHHIMPYSNGGATHSDNCQIVHASCHQQLHYNNQESLW